MTDLLDAIQDQIKNFTELAVTAQTLCYTLGENGEKLFRNDIDMIRGVLEALEELKNDTEIR